MNGIFSEYFAPASKQIIVVLRDCGWVCACVCYLSFDEKLYQRVEQHRKSFVVQKIKTILAGCKQLNVQIFDIT